MKTSEQTAVAFLGAVETYAPRGARPRRFLLAGGAALSSHHEDQQMDNQGSLYETGTQLLASISPGNIKEPPRTVQDVVREVKKLADDADRYCREMRKMEIDNAAIRGAVHNISAHLRDFHTAFSTATNSLSPELKKQLGIKVTT
jgi:hypothetical protein